MVFQYRGFFKMERHRADGGSDGRDSGGKNEAARKKDVLVLDRNDNEVKMNLGRASCCRQIEIEHCAG